MNESQPSRRTSRAAFIGLVLLFVLPLALATFFYVRHEQWAPAAASHGELIHPARPIERFELVSREGKPLTLDFLRGKWTLVHIGGNGCGADCEARLYKTRQARLALGRDMGRLQRLYLAPGTRAAKPLRAISDIHPRLIVATPAPGAVSAMLPARGGVQPGEIYLIDPHANLMMRYAPEISFDGLLEDLEHLLKVSRIG